MKVYFFFCFFSYFSSFFLKKSQVKSFSYTRFWLCKKTLFCCVAPLLQCTRFIKVVFSTPFQMESLFTGGFMESIWVYRKTKLNETAATLVFYRFWTNLFGWFRERKSVVWRFFNFVQTKMKCYSARGVFLGVLGYFDASTSTILSILLSLPISVFSWLYRFCRFCRFC